MIRPPGPLRRIDRADHPDHIARREGKGERHARGQDSSFATVKLSEVQRGQSFFVTRHGKRIAEIGPVRAPTKRPVPGFAKGTFTYVAPDFDAPLDDFHEYER